MTAMQKHTAEELGAMMLEEFLETPASDLVECLIQVHTNDSPEKRAVNGAPSTKRMRKMLDAVATDHLDTLRPNKLDLPKAMQGLEEVMRAPSGYMPVEQFIAAVCHRLLSYECERVANQTEGEAA